MQKGALEGRPFRIAIVQAQSFLRTDPVALLALEGVPAVLADAEPQEDCLS